MLLFKLIFALLSAGYEVGLTENRVCLFGCASETTAQPVCWWCSVLCLSIFIAHIFLLTFYVKY